MMDERDAAWKSFSSSNKVIVDDSAYLCDKEQYEKLLAERPWLKE